MREAGAGRPEIDIAVVDAVIGFMDSSADLSVQILDNRGLAQKLFVPGTPRRLAGVRRTRTRQSAAEVRGVSSRAPLDG